MIHFNDNAYEFYVNIKTIRESKILIGLFT